jgi:DNA (cytosine-5)-methyltransferase 1
MLNHLDLFSGIAGFALAASWTGAIRTVAFVEIDPFCQKVLKKHWPDVPIISDIREVTGERLREIVANTGCVGQEKRKEQTTGVEQCSEIVADTSNERRGGLANEQSTAGIETRGHLVWSGGGHIDILTGGFPCQPFSAAGKRKGKGDDRYLWPEMLRVIAEVGPTWIIGENVAGLINMAQPDSQPEMGCEADTDIEENADCDARGILGGIIDDLENLGYEIQPFVIPACGVGAPHRRDRIWIVAYSGRKHGERTEVGRELEGQVSGQEDAIVSERPTGDDGEGSAPHSDSQRERTGLGEVPKANREISQRDNNAKFEQSNSHAPDTEYTTPSRHGQDGSGILPVAESVRPDNGNQWDEDWYSVALRTCVRNLDDGLPRRMAGRGRVNKLKALGNSVVPQVVYPIMKAICEIEGCKFE